MFEFKGYKQPVLVSSIDGVGTKLKIAEAMDRHDTVGQDLVNHCVNDILTCGAEPLFLLDYIAMGKLSPDKVEAIVKGLSSACQENNCALIGGETAEMPGLYAAGDYDRQPVLSASSKKKILSTDFDYSRRCRHRSCLEWAAHQRLFWHVKCWRHPEAVRKFYPELGKRSGRL